MRRNKGKEFLIRHFQDILSDEGIQFQVCSNPDVKCFIIERSQPNFRDRLYKYFTYKNTNRYVDVLPKFVEAYNYTGHSATGMATSKVTDSDVPAIWNNMHKNLGVRNIRAKIKVGQHVRIGIEKMKFTKGAEHNIIQEIFRIIKVIKGAHQSVFYLEYFNKTDRGSILSGRTDPCMHHNKPLER